MSLSKEAFLWAIGQEESGGKYTARNKSSGAIGKYQVMPSNVASWTKRALGYSMTPAQFAASPSAQEKVAQVILGGYYDKYGAEGAASMWFSGQSNPNKVGSDGSTSIRQYVNNVIAIGGRYSGQGGSGAGEGIRAVAPKLSDAELASQYGLSSKLINSSKELKALFKKAVAGGWTASRFTASLKNTKWWGTQSDTLRQYLTLKYTDPATFKQKQQQAQFDINALAVQVGAGDLLHGSAINKKALAAMVYNSLALGWSDDRIKSWLGARASTKGGIMQGDAGEAFDKLHAIAYENGMSYGSWFTTTAKKIAAGTYTIERAEETIRKQAAAKYSAFAPQIKAGQNVIDLAAPYIQSVSKILEVPDTAVGLSNSHVAKAMMTNKNGQAQSIWDFENGLRKDPAWKKTQNAQDSAMQTAHQVLTQFGLAF